jgi:hypothetical protein
MLTHLAAVLLAVQPAAPTTQAAPDAPPIILTIDGQPHELHDGRTVTLTIDGKPHEVRIDLPTVTRFSGRQISFDFPSIFLGGVLTQDEAVTAHRYLAADAALIVFEFTIPMPFAQLFDDTVAQYGDAVAEGGVADVVLEAEIATLNGRSITINFADGTLRQELYRIANADAATFILIQDTRDDPDQPTEAFTALRASLAKTLKTK